MPNESTAALLFQESNLRYGLFKFQAVLELDFGLERGAMTKRKILVVDDEPNILLSLEYILEQEGYEVHVARDGEGALAVAEKVGPDLILLDVAMPRQDGFEVCRVLREHPRLQTVKIVMLTAKGQPLERKKGLEVGADVYVTKPFSAEDLLAKIRVAIDS